MEVRVCSYSEGPKGHDPKDIVVNTTSRSFDWGRSLSPFFLGPVTLPDGRQSANVENAWQYSKVYKPHVDSDGNPTPAWFTWSREGFSRFRADRYPMGKGAVPLYAYYRGLKLGYVESRKKLYAPLYAGAVEKTSAFRQQRTKGK